MLLLLLLERRLEPLALVGQLRLGRGARRRACGRAGALQKLARRGLHLVAGVAWSWWANFCARLQQIGSSLVELQLAACGRPVHLAGLLQVVAQVVALLLLLLLLAVG